MKLYTNTTTHNIVAVFNSHLTASLHERKEMARIWLSKETFSFDNYSPCCNVTLGFWGGEIWAVYEIDSNIQS